MPIYDQSYRPYRGELSSHALRWWTITRSGLQQLLAKRVFLILLTITFFPTVVFGFQIWFTHQFPEQQILTVDSGFFRTVMQAQLLWFLVLAIYPGSGLISNDLRWNAIQLYLSKPLRKLDYVAGKLAIICTFFLGVTLVPGLVLFALELAFSSDLQFLMGHWWIPFSVLGFSLVASFCAGMVVLALSSLSKSSRFVGVMTIGVVFLGWPFAGFLSIFTSSAAWNLAIAEDMWLLPSIFFGGAGDHGDHKLLSLIMLAIFTGISALVLRAKVRAVEVVT